MNTTTTALGTIGNRIDLSHAYAAGSFQQTVRFSMHNLSFEAQRFVRTDNWGGACDNVDVYIITPDLGTEHIGRASGKVDASSPDRRVHRLMTDRVAARAIALLAVGAADVPSDMSERFAQIELA